MNQYLYSGKEIIDENNPINNPNLMIGYFQWNFWEVHWIPNIPPNPTPGVGATTLDWFQHAITLDIYNLTYVGLEE